MKPSMEYPDTDSARDSVMHGCYYVQKSKILTRCAAIMVFIAQIFNNAMSLTTSKSADNLRFKKSNSKFRLYLCNVQLKSK